ncbi:ISL3 family transposase [Oleiagrimonas sp.]|jgi:transposase|uniref:ISL3 family transposase n=1 Tax=Oleiagrimonas sp. TaxID=2010330 RepID=UPI002608440B|nr:ISL3 family transposase [Oleiagrimonas sp.]MDA3913140.1 ISL3 family transposase [Oleiagrimonas sp.]
MHDAIDAAHFWIGFRLIETQTLSETHLLLRLEADPNIDPRCGRCRMPCGLIHDRSTRRVRERTLFDRQVWLEVPLRRVACMSCGVSTEYVPWLPARSRLTGRLIAHVEALLRLLPIRHISQLTGLHWHTIRAIDARRLAREVTPPDLSRLRRLIMDEFALFKGHRYATVAICADTQQVLWVGEGRSRKDVQPFFEMLGPAVCARIEAVAMDMNTAMDLEAKAHCPNIRVVYDLFHVIAKFGREVIDRVRVDQANVLKADPSARRVIKRSRWLLLRNRGNLTDEQAVKLDDLLAANAPLTTVYVLKAQLKELWYAPDENEARRRWNEWHRLALDSQLPPLIAFAKRLAPYLEGIVASSLYRLNTSVLEGMNNRIKVIKRMAYGYRDSAYFFLKIKDAFPGKAR